MLNHITLEPSHSNPVPVEQAQDPRLSCPPPAAVTTTLSLCLHSISEPPRISLTAHPTAAGSTAAPGCGTSASWRLRQTCPAQMLSRPRCFPPLECCKVRSGTGSTARPFPPFSQRCCARSRGVLPRVGRALQVRCQHTQVPVLQHERAAHQVLHCECVGLACVEHPGTERRTCERQPTRQLA